jgi:hypothetical protein
VDIYQYAIATIVLYPVGILVLCATVLYSVRNSLETAAAQSVAGA